MERGIRKNGTVELMRFVFCIVIILYHIKNRAELPSGEYLSFFANGKIGVEFFFIVSGYLMAKSARKQEGLPVVKTTKRFMLKKLIPILPYHLMTYFINLIIMLAVFPSSVPDKLLVALRTLPNLFLIQLSGLDESVIITPEWYISAMLWMMLLLFPLLLKYRERFSKIACPVIMIILVGYLMHEEGMLGGTRHFVFGEAVPKIYVRAFAEMCGGAFSFEAASFLRRLKLTKADKAFLTLLEAAFYLFPVAYSFSTLDKAYEGYAFYSLLIAVTLSFSEATLTADLMKNKLSYFLGRASLPLYFAQAVPLVFFDYGGWFSNTRKLYAVLFCAGVTFVAAVLFFVFAKPFERLLRRRAGLI